MGRCDDQHSAENCTLTYGVSLFLTSSHVVASEIIAPVSVMVGVASNNSANVTVTVPPTFYNGLMKVWGLLCLSRRWSLQAF